jgi:hypothetical protein
VRTNKSTGQIMEKVDKLKNNDFRRMQWQDLISHIKAFYKLYNKTNMYFLAVEYDVICTEK